DWAEAFDRRAGNQGLGRFWRDGANHRGGRDGIRIGFNAIYRAVHGLRDRRIFPRHQAPRNLLLRRSFEARAVLSRNFAFVATPAGPRSVPWRRLLPPFTFARARCEIER